MIALRIPSHPRRRLRHQPLHNSVSTNDNDSYRSTIDESLSSSVMSDGMNNQTRGDTTDPRYATGIRSSLHPTTINCIAEALLLRSSTNNSRNDEDENNCRRNIAIDIRNPNNEPLQVAIAAGNIASNAILSRSNATKVDGTADNSSIFTTEESQLISGRVVGVVMRLHDLEMELVQRVSLVNWVQKYNEESSFGVLVEECQRVKGGGDLSLSSSSSMTNNEMLLAARIRNDPLFRMNRAECLLALFLTNVERPRMEAMNMILPGGGSYVDFIDDDRLRVILPEYYSKPVTS
jgi:hypothetical protein